MKAEHYMQVGKTIPLPCEDILSSIEEILEEHNHLADSTKISVVLAMIRGWRALGEEEDLRTTDLVGIVTKVYAPKEE